MEAAGGLGLMVGPPMGGFLYGYLNYAMTFYFFSIVIGACVVF
jgi:MFS family permease